MQFESIVVRECRAALKGQRAEGDIIEFKSKFTEPEKYARQLAGHLNASSPNPVIWIFGIDEDSSKYVPLADADDPANWLPAIAKRFDEPPRLLHHRWISIDEVADIRVIALAFDSSEAPPYVIKVLQGRQAPDREVPWKNGSTHSAKRSDLITMMGGGGVAPPKILLRSFVLWAAPQAPNHQTFHVEGEFLIIPADPSVPQLFPTGSVTLDFLVGVSEIADEVSQYSIPLQLRSLVSPSQAATGVVDHSHEFPYGATLRPDGLYVVGPAISSFAASRTVEMSVGGGVMKRGTVRIAAEDIHSGRVVRLEIPVDRCAPTKKIVQEATALLNVHRVAGHEPVKGNVWMWERVG